MPLPAAEAPFQYFDGVKVVYADPLAIYRQILIRTRGKPNELANKVYAVTPDTQDVEKLMESYDAAEQLVALVRDLFKMQPFDEKTGMGGRDEHCWAVWEAFTEFMSQEKKNPGTPPTSTPPTDCPPGSSQPTATTSASS